jgi:SAM-dependent methyltransferase
MRELVEAFVRESPGNGYLRYHARRYATALSLLQDIYHPGEAVLDIGRSPLTGMIARALQTTVDTLDLKPGARSDQGKHYHFDLNRCPDPSLWPKEMKAYDIVVLAEVIEHLHVSPTAVLTFLRSITRDGGRILLQTPNAVALHKRIAMLLGKNPFEAIRDEPLNPGHFREYTRKEIEASCRENGFRIRRMLYGNYFDYRYAFHGGVQLDYRPALRAVNAAYALCPGSFKPGMTFVLDKEPASCL